MLSRVVHVLMAVHWRRHSGRTCLPLPASGAEPASISAAADVRTLRQQGARAWAACAKGSMHAELRCTAKLTVQSPELNRGGRAAVPLLVQ